MLKVVAILVCVLPKLASAQSLTPEEIEAMVSQRMSDLNPYQELLNHPDPARSLAAMEIMMESGDRSLERMALEYGLLSPNPTVKRTAFEGFLASKPILSIRFDGSDVDDGYYPTLIQGSWNGTLTSDATGYWRIAVGDYLDDQQCFANTYHDDDCFITVNSDGVFLTPQNMNARGTISDEGSLIGQATLNSVDDVVPFSVQLID